MSWWTPSFEPAPGGSVLDLFHSARFEEFLDNEVEASQSVEGLKYLSEARAALRLEALASTRIGTPRNEVQTTVSRVLTLMHSAPPHTPGGYTSRAHGLLSSLQSIGIEIRAHTRPGYLDETSRGAASDGTQVFTSFEGMSYKHSITDVKRVRGEYQYMLASIRTYREAMRYFQPDVVHLRSTYLVALPGLIAARQLGIPVIYEVSGLWELVYEGRRQFSLCNRTTRLETVTMGNVDQIATLTGAMKDVIVQRGVPRERVTITPNAVDDARFVAGSTQACGSNEPGSSSRRAVVLGYAGSIVDYEGLDDLIRAVHILKDVGATPVHAVIVGGGPERESLENLVRELGVEDSVTFTGRVSPDEVSAYYYDFDICVLARKDTPATRVVSPLKPFEIMASLKPMIVSDVAALREISCEGKYASVFSAGSAQDLADRIEELVDAPDRGAEMALKAQEYARENHTWGTVASIIRNVMQAAIEYPNISPGLHSIGGGDS